MTKTQTNVASGDPDHGIALMPQIREQGSSVLFNQGINNPSIRIAFMHGENQTMAIGGKYIYASPTNIDQNGNVLGDYNLKLRGIDGWHSLIHEKILTVIDKAREMEFLISMPISYLRYKGKAQIENVNYLIKNTSMTITIKSVKQSVVKLLKL
jgi:hypothetical protein